jgi:hypothetical protein
LAIACSFSARSPDGKVASGNTVEEASGSRFKASGGEEEWGDRIHVPTSGKSNKAPDECSVAADAPNTNASVPAPVAMNNSRLYRFSMIGFKGRSGIRDRGSVSLPNAKPSFYKLSNTGLKTLSKR